MTDDEWGLCKKSDIQVNSFTICNNGHYLYIDNDENSESIKNKMMKKFYGIINEYNIISCFQFNQLYYIILFSTDEKDAEDLREKIMSNAKYENLYRFSIVLDGKEFMRASI